MINNEKITWMRAKIKRMLNTSDEPATGSIVLSAKELAYCAETIETIRAISIAPTTC